MRGIEGAGEVVGKSVARNSGVRFGFRKEVKTRTLPSERSMAARARLDMGLAFVDLTARQGADMRR